MRTLVLALTSLALPLTAWAQDHAWGVQWETSPIWWPFGAVAATLILLVLLGWLLLNLLPVVLMIVATVLGIRWHDGDRSLAGIRSGDGAPAGALCPRRDREAGVRGPEARPRRHPLSAPDRRRRRRGPRCEPAARVGVLTEHR
jgi:hypothetical protein